MTDAKFDVYSHVTEQIIAQIEAGTPPWCVSACKIDPLGGGIGAQF